MSITIRLNGKQATLAAGQWRSADATLQQLLNDHLVELNVPAHWPWQEREQQTASAVVNDFGAQIVAVNLAPADDARADDGSLIVF